MSLAPAVAFFAQTYRIALEPIAPFTWLGLPFSALDVAATVRLCLVMRQLREANTTARQPTSGAEPRSFARDLAATLVVVYGGEAITAPLLQQTPSFMLSGAVPALYAATQAAVEQLPAALLPAFALPAELPLALLDGFTRAYLLCTLVPPAVLASASAPIASSPWTLLLTSLITANAGFFFINLFSFLHPGPLALTTPAELLPFGWTTTDIWCAPLITGLYALLTHAQPFWADAHAFLAPGSAEKGPAPVDPETARAFCALILATMFSVRAIKNYGSDYSRSWQTKRNVKVVSRHGKSRSVSAMPKVKAQ